MIWSDLIWYDDAGGCSGDDDELWIIVIHDGKLYSGIIAIQHVVH